MLDRTAAFAPALAINPPRRSAASASDDIASLLEQANEWHRQAERAKADYMRFVLAAGETLLRIKTKVGHGRWLRWLQDNREKLEFSDRTARLYMDIAQHLPESELATVANLSLREAARMAVLNRSGQRQEQKLTPLPVLQSAYARLIDAALQLAGADVILSYIRTLDEVPPVSRQQFDQAVHAVRRQLPAPRQANSKRR